MLVDAENAEELMALVNKNEEAKVRIEILVEPRWVSAGSQEHTDTHSCKTFHLLAGGGVEGLQIFEL